MTANIMSLGGIAVAIGAMVDAAIVVVEQTHKKLEALACRGQAGRLSHVVISAVKEVGGPSFFALLVIAVGFLPVFTLEAQEGRLFKPLAFTKNFAMIIAAVLAITLDPAMRLAFYPYGQLQVPSEVAGQDRERRSGGKDSQRRKPSHQPATDEDLPSGGRVHAGASLADHRRCRLGHGAYRARVLQKLGSEFMPPLDEGTLLYMPTTCPAFP